MDIQLSSHQLDLICEFMMELRRIADALEKIAALKQKETGWS